MPKMPDKITVDRKQQKLFIDGVEFPWLISEYGPTVEGADNSDEIATVTVSIFAEVVEEIPVCAECDRLDRAEVGYEVVVNGAGEHIRHYVTDELHRAIAIKLPDGRVVSNPDVHIGNVQRLDDGSITATLTPTDGKWH